MPPSESRNSGASEFDPLNDARWRSRSYLPHIDQPGLVQSITFRTADSLPKRILDEWSDELAALPLGARKNELQMRVAKWLDQGYGACHLGQPRIAALVENALLFFDNQRYRLLAWCVMPNHVHILIEPMPGFGLDRILHSWKSFTAKEANRILKRSGEFWQVEYHDRYIRDDEHFAAAKLYIEHNPVKAGLAVAPHEYRWSSAWKGRVVDPDAGGTPAVL
jgi:putative DNA methylase